MGFAFGRDPEAPEYRLPCSGCDGGEYEYGSVCCGAEIHNGICDECKEHAEREVCVKCGGLGTVFVDKYEFENYHQGGYSE